MDILEILEKGESETVEFKARFNKEAIISLVAFANTAGGHLYIGIEDEKREVIGVEDPLDEEERLIRNQFCCTIYICAVLKAC